MYRLHLVGRLITPSYPLSALFPLIFLCFQIKAATVALNRNIKMDKFVILLDFILLYF